MVKTEAVILKSADLNEADRLLTIYTKEFGKIQVIAKGVKKLGSKLRYHIEPLSYSHLILIEGRSFRIVKDAVLMDQFLLMRKELEKIKIAYKVVNFIDELIVGEEKDEDIWNLLLEMFKKLNVGFPKPRIISDFRDDLFRLLGYDPEHVRSVADVY